VRDAFRPNWSALFRMLVSANPQRKEKKADTWTPSVSADVSYLDDRSKNWIVWLGHACYLMQFNGLRFLTDPQLRDMPFVPRRVYPPFSYEEIRGVDYLLLSHDHRDHTDEKCVRAIVKNNPIRKILCPLKLSNVISSWVGDCPIEEAGWYQQFDLEDTGLKITFLPSQHWCRRGLLDFNRVLWGSFMLEVGADAGAGEGTRARTVYFGGDSAATDYWSEIGQLFPNIDLCMLGIGAYSPDFMMRDVHANPEEAFAGYRDLGATYWWPMHHGTYYLSNEPAREPLRRATASMEKAGLEDRLVQPMINERWWF
ncbi:MAG: MBL fold metallo-hydrolase, partial [Bacteroidota bacterium]